MRKRRCGVRLHGFRHGPSFASDWRRNGPHILRSSVTRASRSMRGIEAVFFAGLFVAVAIICGASAMRGTAGIRSAALPLVWSVECPARDLQLAALDLDLAEEPCVLDGENGLGGEASQKVDHLRGELTWLPPAS